MGDFTGFDQLLAAIRQSIRDRATGTLFIRTDGNRSAMVGMKSGEIVTLACGVRQGLDAIPDIRAIQGGSYRLTASAVDLGSSPLPPTREVLRLLEGGAPGAAAAAPPAPAPSSTAAAESRASLDTRPAVQELQRVFGEFIGPIGRVVFQDTLDKAPPIQSRNDLDGLVEALARELGDPGEAERFRRAARSRLKGVIGS